MGSRTHVANYLCTSVVDVVSIFLPFMQNVSFCLSEAATVTCVVLDCGAVDGRSRRFVALFAVLIGNLFQM